MRYLRLMLASLICFTPLLAHAQGMPVPESVEEPDAPDDDTDNAMPPEENVPAAVVPATPVKPDVKLPSNEAEEGSAAYDRVILQGLNKVTARAQTIEATIGSVERFGTIEIIAHSCWKSAPDERPENAALLEISEIKQNEGPTPIFMGWMFSSSPGLSGLENPFYDVTVVRCEKAVGQSDEKKAADDKKPGENKKPIENKKTGENKKEEEKKEELKPLVLP